MRTALPVPRRACSGPDGRGGGLWHRPGGIPPHPGPLPQGERGRGGADNAPSPLAGEGRGGGSNVTAFHSGGAATALKHEPEAKLSPAQQLEQAQHINAEDVKVHAKAAATELRAEARAKGYEGEACGECGNFTLVRNGTCMKCDTCGGTSGCS